MVHFSVLLSVYIKENPEYLSQSLTSVFTQTVLPDEVVLVEDGPLTNELNRVVDDYVQRYPNIIIVPLERNMGLGPALNEGLKHCSYDIVARMDTDDICKPLRFEKQLKFLESHPEIDVVGGWVDEFIGSPRNVLTVRKLPENHDELFKFGKKRNPINHPTVMFRKHSVMSVNSYLPFYLFEDYYLWARMMVNGMKFYNIPESLLYFRTSEETFKRRGGFKYACVEMSLQKSLYKMGYINLFQLTFNICTRFIVRILPNQIRGIIYKKLLHNDKR